MIKILPITYILKNVSGVFFYEKKDDGAGNGMCSSDLFFVVITRSG